MKTKKTRLMSIWIFANDRKEFDKKPCDVIELNVRSNWFQLQQSAVCAYPSGELWPYFVCTFLIFKEKKIYQNSVTKFTNIEPMPKNKLLIANKLFTICSSNLHIRTVFLLCSMELTTLRAIRPLMGAVSSFHICTIFVQLTFFAAHK